MMRSRRLLVSFTVIAIVALGAAGSAFGATTVFINELHYDNTGADTGEFVEIAGPAGTDLAGWTVALYNGSNGTVYATIALSGLIPDQCNGFGALSFAQAGIQNGSPDGLALVDAGSGLVQFLSYEGTFTGVGGAADGLESTDIGVAESGTTAVGESLQLTGSGSCYEDFTWSGPSAESPGDCNSGQTYDAPVSVEPSSWTQIRALYRR